MVKITGQVFKGLLYDQGFNEEGSYTNASGKECGGERLQVVVAGRCLSMGRQHKNVIHHVSFSFVLFVF